MRFIMNYEKIYESFIFDFKNTNIVTRLERRNPKDLRLKAKRIYTERHHIVPKSEGGLDDDGNIIELLPEEHIFIHFLRYKAYGKYNDICAVNFMINGFIGFKNISLNGVQLNKILRKKFRYQREEFAKYIRKNNSGSIAISNARRGTMPVKDSITGEMVGSVPVDHENVISGQWVHHSKGKTLGDKQIDYLRKREYGLNNFNAHKISNEDYMKQTINYVKTCTDGRFIKNEYKKYCEENGLTYIINFSKHRWNGSRKKFIEDLKSRCEREKIPFKYDRYYRSANQKKLLKKIQLGKRRKYKKDGSFTYVKNIK